MIKETGGPAFPVRLPIVGAIHACDEPVPIEIHAGMSLRDYFAGKAMQGMLANPKLQEQILKAGQSWIEESAWKVADAMLKQRGAT